MKTRDMSSGSGITVTGRVGSCREKREKPLVYPQQSVVEKFPSQRHRLGSSYSRIFLCPYTWEGNT